MTDLVRKTLAYSFGPANMAGEFVVDRTRSGPRPGVLVVHEAFGLGEHAIASAERLAGLGYAAIAIDLWGNQLQFEEMPAVMQAIENLVWDHDAWMGRVEAARAVLAAQAEVDEANIAAVGYCFGGATVLEYARMGGRVKGVVSLHGAVAPLGKEWSADRTSAKLLLCSGADDPLIPPSDLAAFQEAIGDSGVDWEIDIYSGTRHSFTNPAADFASLPEVIAYNEQSDRRSRARLDRFLAEIF